MDEGHGRCRLMMPQKVRGNAHLGIYKQDSGGRLTICVSTRTNTRNDTRPKSFSAGHKTWLFTLHPSKRTR